MIVHRFVRIASSRTRMGLCAFAIAMDASPIMRAVFVKTAHVLLREMGSLMSIAALNVRMGFLAQ